MKYPKYVKLVFLEGLSGASYWQITDKKNRFGYPLYINIFHFENNTRRNCYNSYESIIQFKDFYEKNNQKFVAIWTDEQFDNDILQYIF